VEGQGGEGIECVRLPGCTGTLYAESDVDPTYAPSPLALAAMCGKDCVAIASDLRFGINQQQTTAVDMKKIYKARFETCMLLGEHRCTMGLISLTV